VGSCDRGLGRRSLGRPSVAEGKPPWVLYDLRSPLNTPCHSSPTPREPLCALKCLAIHDVGLLATFVPSLANGTVRNRCCYVLPRPRGAQVKLHKGPAGLPHVVSRGDAAFDNDGMCAVSLPLLLGASIASRHTSRPHGGPSMLMQTYYCP
jgi:hypothetical protein